MSHDADPEMHAAVQLALNAHPFCCMQVRGQLRGDGGVFTV